MRRDPYAVPPEYIPRRFTDAVHDFAAEAAVVAPDWEHLRRCLKQFRERPAPLPGRIGNASDMVRADDWLYLDWVARSHQLDGVIAWRLLDPELDAVCPEWVRNLARAEVARLEEANRPWLEAVPAFLDMVKERGIRHAVLGVATTHPLTGAASWPRQLTHVDILAHPGDYGAAVALAEECGRPLGDNHDPDAQDYLRFRGFKIAFFHLPPEHEDLLGHCLWDERLVEDPIEQEILGGTRAWVPRHERQFASMAYATLLSYAWVPERLTVNNLHRLHLLASQPGFDWAEVWKHARTDLSGPSYRSLASARRVRSDQEVGTRGTPHPAWANPGKETARYIAWALDKLEVLYGLPEEAHIAVAKIRQAGPVYFRALSPEDEPKPGVWDAPRRLLCEWDDEPDLEALMFGESEPSTAARLDSGWWREARPVAT